MRPRISEEECASLRAEFLAKDPSYTELDLAVIIGFVVIRRFLGDEWVAKDMEPRQGVSPFLFMPAPGSEIADPLIDYKRQDRIIRLAQLLRELEDLPGFDGALKGFRDEHPASVLAELCAAHTLRKNGHEVEFNPPTGRRGADFDLRAKVYGLDVAVEVKSKADLPPPEYSGTNVRNTVKDAARQLPPQGPGILHLALPSEWWQDMPTRQRLMADLLSLQSRSGRVSGFVLLIDQWVPGRSGGMGRISTPYLLENPAARCPIPNFRGLIGGPPLPADIQLDWVEPGGPH